MSANLKPIPEIEQPELSDDEAVAAINEAMESADGKKTAPAKPETPEDGTGEEGEEQPELVTLPGGEQVAIEDLPSKMVFEVPDGEDGETREVSGSTVIKEGLKALEGKTHYERESADPSRVRRGAYPVCIGYRKAEKRSGVCQACARLHGRQEAQRC